MLKCKEFVNSDEIAKGLSPFNSDSIAVAVEASRIMYKRIKELIASGEIKSLKEARKMIAHTESLRIFEPEKQLCWDKAALRFQEIFAYTKN